MRKRKIFALGLPCCLAFLIAMSQFVWAIDFEGNVSITDDVLMDFLAEKGIDYGVAKIKSILKPWRPACEKISILSPGPPPE